MKRSLLVLPLLALALVAVACSTSGDENGSDDGPPEGTTSTTAPDAPAGDDPDQVVWQESTGGGFVPTQSLAAEVPAVTIYADGRIFLADPDEEGRFDHPAQVTQAQVALDALDEFLAAATDSGVFGAGVDFGEPSVTDQPSTTVTLLAGGAPRTVNVYALGFDDPAGVTAAQAGRRTALTDLLADARALSTDAAPWVPDRVRATAFGPVDVAATGAISPSMWPGPSFSQFPADGDGDLQSCLVIEGDDAAAVYQAAVENDGNAFSDDGEVRQIVVAPLLPGQEGCPPT